MSEKREMTGRTPVTAVSETDRLYVERSGSLEAVSFAALAKAVRDTLKIGGRNLLLESGEAHTGSYGMGSYYLAEALEPGNEYVLTFRDVEIGEGKQDQIQVWNSTASRCLLICTRNEDGLYQQRFKLGETANPGEWSRLTIHVFPNSVTTVSRIGRAKLERGNVATDWTPAPEDLESAISGGGNLRYLMRRLAGRRAA